MLQRLNRDLSKYHDLFTSKRCSGWELEELIVAAIKSDTQTQHHVQWQEAGHDDLADITVRTNRTKHLVQIKSGQIRDDKLILSGHRLGRFNGVMEQITEYLNEPSANIIAVPYRQLDGNKGRQHIYQVCYINMDFMTEIADTDWERKGKQWAQVNAYGVEFSLRPSMSWQIWWAIPCHLIEVTDEFIIG